MIKQKLVIIGTSITAMHFYHFVKKHNLFDVIAFAVDRDYIKEDKFFGLNVYAIEDLELYFDRNDVLLFVALLWDKLNSDRKNIYLRLKSQGYSFANAISPLAQIYDEIRGDNCWIHDNVSILPQVVINDNVIVFPSSVIGSKSIIGAHSFFGINSTVLGKCVIGEQVFIGTSATVYDGRTVGDKCIVGACSAVRRDLPSFSIVKVSSESYIIKHYTEEVIESKLISAESIIVDK